MFEWALATIIPNGERRVSEELSKRKFPFHIFKRKLLVAQRGKLVEKLVPAFPRYIFVPFNRCWQIVSEISGILGIVRFGDDIARVRHTVIEKLISLCVGDHILVDERQNARFHFGDNVWVNSINSLINHRAKYHHSVGEGRAVVLMEIMGRSVFVNVNECDLREVVKNRKQRRRYRQRRMRYSEDYSSRSHALTASG